MSWLSPLKLRIVKVYCTQELDGLERVQMAEQGDSAEYRQFLQVTIMYIFSVFVSYPYQTTNSKKGWNEIWNENAFFICN